MKLYGKNPVIERLRSNPKSIRKIYIVQGHKDAPYIGKKAKQWGISVHAMPKSKMLKMSRTPVRDALLMLENEGLVVRQGSRGLQVRQLRIEEFIHALRYLHKRTQFLSEGPFAIPFE